MTNKEKENQKDAHQRKKIVSPNESESTDILTSEMSQPNWSVVSFESRVATGLTYDKAVKKLKKLAAEKVAGLCIVTDEAAKRITN